MKRRAGVDLYWLPLGAGGHCVRFNGRVFEPAPGRHLVLGIEGTVSIQP